MWTNGTKNVVSLSELTPVDKEQYLIKDTKVKMLYKKRWYYGTILMLDDSQCEDISSDDEQVLADFLPLSRFNNYKDDSKKMKRNAFEIMKKCTPLDSTIESDVDDSDLDPDHKELCEIKKCTSVGENTCLCGLLLCVTHWSPSKCDHNLLESSDDSIVLNTPTKKKQKLMKTTLTPEKAKTLDNSETLPASCSSKYCDQEIFAACTKCLALLCFRHFDEDDDCQNHTENFMNETPPDELQNEREPESFILEGSTREAVIKKKEMKTNKS